MSMSLEDRVLAVFRAYKGDPNVELNEFQKKAVDLLESRDDNFLIVGPTGIGKTLIGVAAILKYGKGFYLAPLRSLMREKYLELRKMFPKSRVVLTNKDYSIPRRLLKEADIRILSPYKFIIYADLLEPDDGVVVIDEIHMINKDPEMEAAVSTIKSMGFRIVALSATIHKDDIAKMSRWLNATAVVAEQERPVPLQFVEVKLQLTPRGRLLVERGAGFLRSGEDFASKEAAVAEIVARIRSRDPGGGILVWNPVRREANSLAVAIARRLPTTVPGASRLVFRSSEHDDILRYTLERGVGIHHGGISQRNRELVEDLFHKKKINVVVSCYTLSHGVNFPVRYLIITSLFDYDGTLLDPSTFHQIAGRAGRPGLDDFGEVIVVTLGDLESFLLTRLLAEKATRVRSKIYNKWTMTKIAAQRLILDKSIDGFVRFLRETYYVQEHGPRGLEELKELAEEVLGTVVDAYFVMEGERIYPKGRGEAIAAAMGLHPKEWWVHETMIANDYKSSVLRAAQAAQEARGINDRDVVDKILDYGFLAIYIGGWKVRDVAEMTQTILDAAAVYVKRLYGWKSQEFQNARRIAEMFIYGGNPNAEFLARVLRHDEMKRVIRNVPQVLFAEGLSTQNILELVRNVVRLVFEFKRKIYLKRVYRVVDAALMAMLGDEEEVERLKPDARKVAYSEIESIIREIGAVVIR
jgi:superfamily II DNA or RNA helicase